ncbi:hypothetical protein JL720_14970 [Aureococcus anophagefferens]|nr:hypothetical protein JL720_14970 [Aureococcus anophagefferens]
MPKKKFIDKKASTTYSVVHRSQQDGAWGIEDRPSERVLLAQRPGALPRAAFAGDEEIGREYEAVTLDPALMDGDVADALFDDAAFEGCEELLDDFVDDYDDDDDDDDDGVASGVARIALEEAGGVLEAMMDEAVKDREAFLHGEDQSFFDPQGPADIVVEGEEERVVEGEADRELDAMYAAEDAKELEDAPQWDCESILSTTSNLDNRPKVIDDAPPRGPSRRRAPRSARSG